MSLRLKYWLTLNVAILVVWAGYAYWNFKASERSHIRAEVNAIKYLGLGLRLSVRQLVHRQEPVERIQPFLKNLARSRGDLDIMIIGRDFRVLAATLPGRIGLTWHEPDIESVLKGTKDVIWKSEPHLHAGRQALDATIGVRDPQGRMMCAIHVAIPLDLVKAAASRQRRRDVLFAVVLLVAVGVILNLLTYKLVIRPIDRLHRTIARSGWETAPLEQKRDGQRRRPRTGNELDRLSQAFREMLDRVQQSTEKLQASIEEKDRLLEQVQKLKEGLAEEVKKVREELMDTQARLVRSERLSAQEKLSAALAHELRNPLHIVRGTAETAARKFPGAQPFVDDIVEEVDRVEKLIKALLTYTRPVTPQMEQLDAEALLNEVADRVSRGMVCKHCAPREWKIRCTVGDDRVHGDRFLLSQALVNLVTNACEASPEGIPVELCVSSDGAGGVLFQVLDRGPGVAEEDRQRLFEAFFTRKASGTGLGLAMVLRVADLHGGSVELKNRPDQGAVAALHIPGPNASDGSSVTTAGVENEQSTGG